LHGSHVAWQEQKIPFAMGKEVLSYAKYFHLFLPCNMAAVQNLFSFAAQNCFQLGQNSPFPLAQGRQLHVGALDLIPCLIPCHRCEKSAREPRQTHHFDQAT